MASATPKVGRHLPSTSTLEWHPAMAHLAMAPSNGNTSTAPSNGTTSTLKVGRHPSSTPHWHPAMAPPPPPTIAHYNGTLQWHPAMAPRPLPQSWSLPSPSNSTLQWHPTMAPSNGTTSTAPCNGTLVPRPIRQSGSSPSPLLEVRTPIAIAIWGIISKVPGRKGHELLTLKPSTTIGCERLQSSSIT